MALLAGGGLAAGRAPASIDCWVAPRVQPTTGYGDALAAPRHAAMRQRLQRALELLQADAALQALPGLRLQAKAFLGAPAEPVPLAQAEVSVGLHRAAVWGRSGCTLDQARADYVVPVELGARFNDPAPLLQLLESPLSALEAGFFPEPPVTGRLQGLPVYGGRVLLLGPPGVDPLLPHAPPRPPGSGPWPPMVRLNPALWRGQPEHALRLLVLHVWINHEPDPLVGAAEAWLQQLDLQPWRALINP